MFPGGVFELLKQVISSWQVILVALVFILYVSIVNNAAKSYRRPRVKKIRLKRQKTQPVASEGGPEEANSSANSNDELGLEEA